MRQIWKVSLWNDTDNLVATFAEVTQDNFKSFPQVPWVNLIDLTLHCFLIAVENIANIHKDTGHFCALSLENLAAQPGVRG